MTKSKNLDVIIIGGSYAGMSAALALGRSLRNVLIIDGGAACNRFTPHSHNFITQDGSSPAQITAIAKKQVLAYDGVNFIQDLALSVKKENENFVVTTQSNGQYSAKKILLSTGVRDLFPSIEGFDACWGKSVLHCPYCHGFEVHHQKLGIVANGDSAFELCALIQHWTEDLTLFSNGPLNIKDSQLKLIQKLNITIIDDQLESFSHQKGYINHVMSHTGKSYPIDALFARIPNEQHTSIPAAMGCELNEGGLILTDEFQQTTVPGVYAAGDNATKFRSVALVVADGTKAGIAINMALINEALPVY